MSGSHGALSQVLDDAGPDSAAALPAVVQRWLNLSELGRRSFEILAKEIDSASSLVETNVGALSGNFQHIVELASGQVKSLEDVIVNAHTVEVDGERMPLNNLTVLAEDILMKVINTVLTLSKHAMGIVYALDDVVVDVVQMESAIKAIEEINRKTTFLSLNARIEAERGNAATFKVVAEEVRELAGETNSLAASMRTRISNVSQGVKKSHQVLKSMATIDMVDHITARETLQKFMHALSVHNEEFTTTLAATSAQSVTMSDAISQLVTGIQFQDRTKQHLCHVVETLNILGQAFAAQQEATREATPGIDWEDDIDNAWLAEIIDNYSLSDLRMRFETGMSLEEAQAPTGLPDPGSIELF